jgi:trans-aconitate methyltransferase
LFSLFVCFSHVLLADGSPQWQIDGVNAGWKDECLALKYFHHSELQRQWAWHLLSGYRFKGDEQILDFGCGDGKIAAEVSHFIPQGHITGVDSSSSMIALAKRCFPSVYYPNVAFEQTGNASFNDAEKNTYDLIFSFCVFHRVPPASLREL